MLFSDCVNDLHFEIGTDGKIWKLIRPDRFQMRKKAFAQYTPNYHYCVIPRNEENQSGLIVNETIEFLCRYKWK